ncbi:hypothetical protein AB0K00_44555 [Dactylosporangium sp. NPDC049525]|uniref:hypothetical protein n=1 Tax=Dactylosporangium sp. NPDC049525 TaxID=3154730 RepID=UPI00342A3F3F
MLGSPLHSRPPVPDKDRALDDHELRAARALATSGYWLPAQAVIAAAGTGWERRGHRMPAPMSGRTSSARRPAGSSPTGAG